MSLSEFDLNKARFIPAILAGLDTAPRVSASQNPSATPHPQSGRNHYCELRELVWRLQLVRAALMMESDSRDFKRSRALDVVNQAIKDVHLAIESSCGWSVVRLDVKEPKNPG